MTKPRPYADAPTLPSGDSVAIASLVSGEHVEIEIGPGRGAFLIERADAELGAALIGLEVRRKWAAVVDARLAKRGLAPRARVFAEDARFALPRLEGSVRRFFISFPDPWWKKRHQKRLVMNASLLDAIVRLLEPGGELFVQTDVLSRADEIEKMISEHGVLHGERIADHRYVARSNRERRAMADGLPIHRMRFTK